MNINVWDKFILHSAAKKDVFIKVVNVNDYRPPDWKYALDVYDDKGHAPDYLFFGDDWFEENKEKLEKIEE